MELETLAKNQPYLNKQEESMFLRFFKIEE